ncbi:MAG: response regulator, partial [Flavobacteriales bacterium]
MKKLRVFLVDDNDIDLTVNNKLIQLAEITKDIVVFSSGTAFLNKIQNDAALDQWDNVLLLDIMMPGMSGFDCMVEFEKLPDSITSQFRVFMLSSSIDRNDIRRA